MRLAQLILFTGDVERLRGFYVGTLGVPVLEEEPGWIRLDAGGAVLALHALPSEPAVVVPTRREDSYWKPCFHTDDVDATRAQLVTAGVAMEILTSDIYEWHGNGNHVLHVAYGLAGGHPGGGTEVIYLRPDDGRFECEFFGPDGSKSTHSLTIEGDTWLVEGDTTRCTATFSKDNTVMDARHEARDEHGEWRPSMNVVLTKAG